MRCGWRGKKNRKMSEMKKGRGGSVKKGCCDFSQCLCAAWEIDFPFFSFLVILAFWTWSENRVQWEAETELIIIQGVDWIGSKGGQNWSLFRFHTRAAYPLHMRLVIHTYITYIIMEKKEKQPTLESKRSAERSPIVPWSRYARL
jgi:hypothetical protein